MVYTTIKNRISRDIIKYQFAKSDNIKLTYEEFIQLLINKDKDFIKEFDRQLREAPTELSSRPTAFFWECVPVSENTTNREFEFVVVKSKVLNDITCDYSNFVEHFRQSQSNYVVSFPSLSGDTLVVPTPLHDDYKNLKEFSNNASLEQKEHFWQRVGEKMKESLIINANGSPRWLSTSGLGVSYLHVRIDSRPKYYSFDEYRHFQSQQANTQQQPFWQSSFSWWQKKD